MVQLSLRQLDRRWLLILLGGAAGAGSWAAARNPWNLVVLEDQVSNGLGLVALGSYVAIVIMSAEWREWRRRRRAVSASRPANTRVARGLLAVTAGLAIIVVGGLLLVAAAAGSWGYWRSIEDPGSELRVAVLDPHCSGPYTIAATLYADRGIATRRVPLERIDGFISKVCDDRYDVTFVSESQLILERGCEAVTITFDATTLDVRDRATEEIPCEDEP